MEVGGGPPRVSHERIAVDALIDALSRVPDVEVHRGQRASNRFDVPGWDLPVLQRPQFGDLRVEAPSATVVVEFESAGTVGNLVKYWPLLAAAPQPKRFVIVHVFQLGSAGDYTAHRRLWAFLRDRMRDDLTHRGVRYPEAWEAELFTYHQGAEAADATAFVQATCSM